MHTMRNLTVFILFLSLTLPLSASWIFIPMNESQDDHLKAYGVTYWSLEREVDAYWLLNYEGGSFVVKHNSIIEKECKIRGVTYQVIPDGQLTQILTQIANPEANMDAVKLDKAPKVAVYSPSNKQPWDDAVTLVLAYAEIPYDVIYDVEVLDDKLADYDWLHLHHEDFTGQYGKFYVSQRTRPWYIQQQKEQEALANALGFEKVSQLKLAVVKKTKDFIAGGGFMFAMCSATDTYDIALSAEGLDICESMFDGDSADPTAESKTGFFQNTGF